MGKTTQSTTQSSSPPPNVLANYQALVDRATNVANTPYQPYTGQVVPDLTADQLYGMHQLDMSGLVASPYYAAAGQYLNQSTNPLDISASHTSQYVAPYAQSGASNATAAGQGLAAYGINSGNNIANYGVGAGQGIGNYAYNIGAQGPQLEQYNYQNLQGFLDPYTQSVIDTTSQNIDRSNAIQQNSLLSSAIKAGNAFGGDRAGVAQAELARNQDLAKNQTIAGLESQGFQNAQSQFNQNNAQALQGQQAALSGLLSGANLGLGALGTGANIGLSGQQAGGQLGLAGAQLGTSAYQNAQQLALNQQQAQNQFAANAGNAYSNLGTSALNAALASGNAQLQSGNLQQQQVAAQLAWPYQQYQQALAFPYQQTQFLGNAILGTGSQSGGTGTTTSPGPNLISQGLGLGATALGAYLGAKDGGAVERYAPGGSIAAENIHPINFSASPLGLAGINPAMGPMVARGKGPPSAPSAASNGSSNNPGLTQGAGALGKYLGSGSTMGSPGVTVTLPVIGAAGDYAVPTFMHRGGMAESSGGLVPYGPYGGSFADGGDVIDATDLPPLDEKYLGLGQPWSPTNAAIENDVGGGPQIPSGLAPAPSPSITPTQTAGVPMPQPRPAAADTAIADNSSDEGDESESTQALSYAPQTGGGLAGTPAPAPAQGGSSPDAAAALQAALQSRTIQHPSFGQALMAAGLGMMASRNPTLLGGIGEGGLAGLKNYEEQQKEINDLDAHPMIDSSGKTKLIIYPSTGQVIDTGIPTEAAAQQEQRDLQNASAPLIRGPNGQMIPNAAYLALKKQEADINERDKTKVTNIQTDNGTVPIIVDRTNKKAYDLAGNEITKEQLDSLTGLGEAKSATDGTFDYRKGTPQLQKGDAVPEPPTIANHAPDALKRDAEYYLTTGQLPKASVNARNNSGVQQMNYQRAVQNYAVALAASKGITMAQLADLQRFGANAAKFPLSRQGDQTVAIGTAIRHINALEDYARAWDAAKGNVNAPILRQAAAKFATALGKEEPTNLQQAARIAGPEIIKAIGVAGAGTGGERFAQEEGFQPTASTPQILGAANVARTFLAGQLPAKEAQARNVGFPHDRFMDMVGPQEYDYLSAINHGKPPNGQTIAPAAKPIIHSKSEYDALPPNTEFVGADGKPYKKP